MRGVLGDVIYLACEQAHLTGTCASDEEQDSGGEAPIDFALAAQYAARACASIKELGSLSKTTTTPKMTPSKKMNLYFTSEIRDCLDLFGSPMTLKTC